MGKLHKRISPRRMIETVNKKEQIKIVEEIIKNEKGAEIIENEENKIKMYVNAIILYYFYDFIRLNKTKDNHLNLEDFWNEKVAFTEAEKKEQKRLDELEEKLDSVDEPDDIEYIELEKKLASKERKRSTVCSDVEPRVGYLERENYLSENVKLEVLKVIYNYLENNHFEYEGKQKKLAKKFKPKWLLYHKEPIPWHKIDSTLEPEPQGLT